LGGGRGCEEWDWGGRSGRCGEECGLCGIWCGVVVGMKLLRNHAVDFAGGRVSETRSVSLETDFLYRGNVLTMLGGEDGGIVWLESFTVA
jgi:hypothetical protein